VTSSPQADAPSRTMREVVAYFERWLDMERRFVRRTSGALRRAGPSSEVERDEQARTACRGQPDATRHRCKSVAR
jgi:hypothetical protein